MKIEIIHGDSSPRVQENMNKFLKDSIEQGFIIIDYGLESRNNSGVYGYIKYCDKQFLREYKINSIMNEKEK